MELNRPSRQDLRSAARFMRGGKQGGVGNGSKAQRIGVKISDGAFFAATGAYYRMAEPSADRAKQPSFVRARLSRAANFLRGHPLAQTVLLPPPAPLG